jgi:hypothetical protein
MRRMFFDTHSGPALAKGSSAARDPRTVVAEDGKYQLFYTPFERVNAKARLVIVGITPGGTQLENSYDALRSAALRRLPAEEMLALVAAGGTFSGKSMRPGLVRMLDAKGVSRLMGVEDANLLWGSHSHLLHGTSVVPHAAFDRKGKKFNGSFDKILGSVAMRESFELDFVPSLAELSEDALFIGLGVTPREALNWCVANGHLRAEQILGTMAHPSTEGGSQLDVYLGVTPIGSLKPNDPVRLRTYLPTWSEELGTAVHALEHST